MSAKSNCQAFFELSYPANNKIPFVADCLELKQSPQFGRYITTKINLSPGDVVAVETPFFHSITGKSKCCINCLKTSLKLISCPGLCSSIFCSQTCFQSAWKKFHKFECEELKVLDQDDNFALMVQRVVFQSLDICGNVEELKIVMQEISRPTNIFEVDLKSSSLKDLLNVCMSLEASQPSSDEIKFATSFVKNHRRMRCICNSDEEENCLINFTIRIIGIMNRNSYTMQYNDGGEAGALFLFTSLINHSCCANLHRINIGNKLALVVKHPIEKGKQLFICYHDLFYQRKSDERKSSLKLQFDFDCSCEACNHEYPLLKNLRKFDKNFEKYLIASKDDDGLKNFRLNNEYIKNNFNEFPCFELCYLMRQNHEILQKIARK